MEAATALYPRQAALREAAAAAAAVWEISRLEAENKRERGRLGNQYYTSEALFLTCKLPFFATLKAAP